MQTRLLACIAGCLLGVAVTPAINDHLALSPTLALIGCSSLGAAVGYVASMLFDVFAASAEDKNAESSE